MTELARRRRALIVQGDVSEWDLKLYNNTTVQAVIDGHDIAITYLPATGNYLRQINMSSKKEITLQAGETIGLKYSQIGTVKPQKYLDIVFWSKTPNSTETSRAIASNIGFLQNLNTMLELTATEEIIGKSILIQARNGDQSYNPPLQLHFEMYVNGRKLK